MSLVAALVAVGQRSAQEEREVAEEQRTVATARQLLAQAESIGVSDPRTAERLALAAYELYPGRQTEAAMFKNAVGSHVETSLTDHTGAVQSVAVSPDGHTLATGSADRTVILWDLTDPTRLLSVLRGLVGTVTPTVAK